MTTHQQAKEAAATLVRYFEGSDPSINTTVPTAPAPFYRPIPWYEWAKKQIGTKEVAGKASNPLILEWLKDAFEWADDDSTLAWCGIFVKEALESCGMPYAKGFASSRAWLKYGEHVPDGKEELGDIAVFWRGSKDGWKGHVGFYAGKNGDNILVLGGNQSDSVSISPQTSYRLLGFRRPDKTA